MTNIAPTFLSSSPCLPFGCFIQVIGCTACSGRSATTSEAWVWMQWTLTKDHVYCSFLITWHSLDHLDEQGRWLTSSEHFHLFLSSRQYKWHLIFGGYGTQPSPHKAFLLQNRQIPSSHWNLQFCVSIWILCYAQTCTSTINKTAELTRPANCVVVWRKTRRQKLKDWHDLMCIHPISFISKRWHIWAVVSNNIIEDCERKEIPFLF